MSFAPNKKETNKKAAKSPAKLSQAKELPQNEEAVHERINLLEDIVAKLQMQHSMFEPLLELLNQVPDVVALEDQAKSFLDQANLLEEKIATQHTQASEIEKKTAEVAVPVALSEGQTTASRSLPQMMNAVAEIEANVQATATKRRASAKRHEDNSKEHFGKSVDSLRTDLTDVQAFLKERTAKFLKEHQEKIASLEEKGSMLKERQKQDQALIEEALEKHAKHGDEAGESWLQVALNSRVKDALEDLSRYLDYNYRQLDVMYKQHLLALKNSYQRVLTTYYTVFVSKKPAAEAANARAEAVSSIGDKLSAALSSQTLTLQAVASSLNESLGQLEEKAMRFSNLFRTVEEPEKTELLNAGKVDFEQWLQGLWYNVDVLRDNVEQLETNTVADSNKISEFLQELQGSAKHDEVEPKAQAASQAAQAKLGEAKHVVLELTNKLFALWKAINALAPWTIDFTEKKPGDAETFQEVPALVLPE